MKISAYILTAMSVCMTATVHAGGEEQLQEAILRGESLAAIEQLIKSGIDVNSEVELVRGYKVPLLCAMVHDVIYQEECDSKPLNLPYSAAEAAEMLLRNGANPNVRDHMGRTPLHYTQHALAQHYLLQAGADPKLADEDGNLPEVPEAQGVAVEGAPIYEGVTPGMTPAQLRELGVCYAEGKNGKPVNEAIAVDLYECAAQAGDSTAARWMGWRYRQGRGVGKDRELSNYYFSLAAAAGDKAALKAMDDLAPEKVAGKSLHFRCVSEKTENPNPTRDDSVYAFLTPGGEQRYYVTWQLSNTESGGSTSQDGEDYIKTTTSYHKTGKNAATVTYTFESAHGGGNVSQWYTRTFELIFTSATNGYATCTVTGKPSTIQADKIIYTGTFNLIDEQPSY
ncbi:MAG: hypothetical protein Q4A24_03300 [Akkermansia sp.]|nr:hypothetical protein [Akkermansia sp.]